jgi:mannose-1-phosphate guanylyltransferase
LSRSQRPKQLLKILSPKSLIVETADRAFSLSGRSQTLVVTVAEQLRALRREMRALPSTNFLAEPQGKNTAPCIGLAALELVKRNPDAIMVVLPADHWVADVREFQRTLRAAVGLAERHDQLITVGIRPDYPETGYGYIMKGKPLGAKTPPAIFRVKRFTEKPTVVVARRLLRQGSLWNSGIFVWKAATLLESLARYQPEIAKRLAIIGQAATGKSLGTPRLRPVIAREYKKMPSISIDYAVLEPAGSEGRVLTLEADFGWSDIGSWAAVHRMMHKDSHGNAGNGRWIGMGAKNCLVHAPDRLVVLLGLENAVVVDTPDALLVGDLRRSQEVRELVEQLKKKGYGSYTVK